MGTLLLGSFLIALAGALVYDSFLRLLNDGPKLLPEWPALIVAALSIFSKEWIYRYTNAAGRRLRSDMLIANAWHSRSDVTVHIDVEYDLSAERDEPITAPLSLREDVVKTLQDNWRGVSFADRIRRMNLHYLEARIRVEVFMLAALF